MAEVLRLKCFSCGSPLSADSRSLDLGYICPHCGSKNYEPLSFKDFQKLMQGAFESFDYSVHVKMGELQDEIDKALEEGDEKRALEKKRGLIFYQIKAAPFFYKTDEQKSQAYDQMLYQWQREFLDPKGRDLKKKYEEAEKENDTPGFAKAMYEFLLYKQIGMPHMSENWNPKESIYRTTKYSLDRFEEMTSEKKDKIMASLGWKVETTKGKEFYCTNCGANLKQPVAGSSVIVCPYCKSEVVIGTAYEGLSSLTGGFSNTYVFKSCPNCGETVPVESVDTEVESCPHCGYNSKTS